MRISSFAAAAALSAALVLTVDAFGGPVAQADDGQEPADAFRLGAEYYNVGELEAAFDAFSEAAEQGNAIAQWKVGRMYADGEGIPEDDFKAFQMFSQIADAHAEDNPYSPVSRIVADAFVSLGHYYKQGIAAAGIQPDAKRALDLFTHAATYFGDANAQYHLGRMYIEGDSVSADPSRAARWLNLAARKNHATAQATLGDMLVYGHGVNALPAQGYMWLVVAKELARPGERDWILDLNHRAEQALSEEQRAAGEAMALQWLERSGS